MGRAVVTRVLVSADAMGGYSVEMPDMLPACYVQTLERLLERVGERLQREAGFLEAELVGVADMVDQRGYRVAQGGA